MMELNSGYKIPKIGYGTWRTPVEVARASVLEALRCGFRHIDAAASYENETGVGEGIAEAFAEGLVSRDDIFVTSKVWNTERGYDKTLRAFDKSMSDLGLEYLDLYLIHWPANPFQFDDWKQINAGSWKAMEEMVKAGRVRSIGLSNFMPRHIKPLLDAAEIVPAVAQIEYHPGWTQPECVEFCRERGIAVEAWSPLAEGGPLREPLLIELAAKYGCSVPQLILAWIIHNGIIPLSKSVTPSRMKENLAALDLMISDEDALKISALGYCGGKCRNPDLVPY
jgi:diketogulonate reductase-like aldo/keto reductase